MNIFLPLWKYFMGKARKNGELFYDCTLFEEQGNEENRST